jgi:AAHS family 4-hydroxybenzoate transporter-like MFS transporter
MLLDGFDLTVIGVAVPKIAEYLRVKPQALAIAISAGQFGPLLGAAFLGMLADRVGRKRMLVVCAFFFGLFTLFCAFITSVAELALFRFIAGLGMGGAIPTAIALDIEYASTRSRATLATVMYAGVPLGATTAGLSAMYLLPHYGWQSVFVTGAIPIVLALVMAFLLPESLIFLTRQEKGQAKVRSIVAKIAPALVKDKDIQFYSTGGKRRGVPVKHFFLQGRTTTTVLLWVCFFLGYYLMYLMNSWAPTLLKRSGASIQQYSLVFALVNFPSIIATPIVGRLMDKFKNPYRILQGGYVLGFLSLVGFGYFAGSPFIFTAAFSVFCGLFIYGTVGGLVALVTLSYPTDITGSAVGWAYAIGRSGATVAPLVGGFLIGLNWSVFRICGTSAIGALIIVGLIGILFAHAARVPKAASSAY